MDKIKTKFNVHTFGSSASEHRKLNTEVRETKGDQKKKTTHN